MIIRPIPGPAGKPLALMTSQMTQEPSAVQPGLSQAASVHLAELANEEEHSENVRRILGEDVAKVSNVTIGAIHDGVFDLKVPNLVAVVDDFVENGDGTIILHLKDHTGRIVGYISPSEMSSILEMFQPRRRNTSLMLSMSTPSLGSGCTVVLHGVSIFISRTNFCRYLNITCANVKHILPPSKLT